MTFPVALIIGGTTDGIGKAFADMLIDNEEYVTVLAPTPQELDVTSRAQVNEWFNAGSPVDYVFYSAGTKHLNWIHDLDINEVKHTFAVNVFGFLNVVSAMVNRQSKGRICVVTSQAAVTPMRTSVDYCASKAALHMAIKVAAKELAPDWHITGIMPSVVTDTEMTKNDIIAISSLREWPLEEVREKMIPMGANIVKADIAQMAYWLLFESPNVMTGSIVEVSAGV